MTPEVGQLPVSNSVHRTPVRTPATSTLYERKRLPFRQQGRAFRLTDVYGEVVGELLA